MGRGNVATHNECEGLFYLDRDFLDTYVHVSDRDAEPKTARQLNNADIEYNYDGSACDWKYSHMESDDNWKNMIEIVQDSISKRFPSFYTADEWRDRDAHVILESGLFQIAVVDNEWSAALCLLERTDVDDTGANRTFMRRHCDTYLEAMKQTLIDTWGEAIGYGGAWVHGQKYTKETPSVCNTAKNTKQTGVAYPSSASKRKPSLLGKLDDNKQKVERDKAANKDKPTIKKRGSKEVTD